MNRGDIIDKTTVAHMRRAMAFIPDIISFISAMRSMSSENTCMIADDICMPEAFRLIPVKATVRRRRSPKPAPQILIFMALCDVSEGYFPT